MNTANMFFKKSIIVLCVAASLLVAVGINEYMKGDYSWCFEDRDICTIKSMDKLRAERDSKKAELQKQIIDTETFYNNKINPMKSSLTGATITNEIKSGRKENVPEGILSFRIIPQALAASGDTMNDSNVRMANHISIGRYGEALANVLSPYANVPIEKYCNTAEVKQDQCDILVGIAHAESTSGTNFKCNFKTREEAIKLGQEYYFNPVGIKDFTSDGLKKNPDDNGCYLRKFASWNAFWEFYPAHMKQAYFDKGAITPEVISKWYVGGNGLVKYGWVNRVKFFTNKLSYV